jgi:hypothetical protein
VGDSRHQSKTVLGGGCVCGHDKNSFQSPTEQDSATSGFRSIRAAAFGLLKEISRPPPPALGYPWDRKQSFDFGAITGVDAKYIADGEIMIRSFHYSDLISSPDVTFGYYA